MDDNCTVYKTADIIAKKWTLLIILSINKSKIQTKRYNEIKNDLGSISPKILSSRLKELESESIISKRIDQSQIPIKTYYSLTASGKDLVKIIQDIKKWGLKWKFKNPDCKTSLCKNCTL